MRESGGVPGVATDLLQGLARRGHRIDCLLPGRARELPERVRGEENIAFVWGTAERHRKRWYNRTRITAFASGLLARGVASVRLRREVLRRHRQEPYDVIYQFSTIETVAVPARLARSTPLVIHPETHAAGELRYLIRERRLALRCQPLHGYLISVAVMGVRALVQRRSIGRARLLVCISSVFRDHLVNDYGYPLQRTVVIPNPVRLARFPAEQEPPREPRRCWRWDGSPCARAWRTSWRWRGCWPSRSRGRCCAWWAGRGCGRTTGSC